MVTSIVKIFVPANYYFYVAALGKELQGYPAVSLTGSYCALRCKHCSAKILEKMLPAPTPRKLLEIAKELRRRGAESILVSGGSNARGQVPFEEYVEALKHIKKMGFRVYIHTGLVDEYRAQLLREAEVDVALIDFIVDKVVIRDVLHLKALPEDFVRSVKNLLKFSVKVAPHIVIGIYCGKYSGEKRAIDILQSLNPDAVILVAFVPLPGTPYENCKPPQPSQISEVLRYAKTSLRDTPLSYGCMKPHGDHYYSLEVQAVQLGFDGLAFPSYSTIEYFIENNIQFKILQDCCAYIALS